MNQIHTSIDIHAKVWLVIHINPNPFGKFYDLSISLHLPKNIYFIGMEGDRSFRTQKNSATARVTKPIGVSKISRYRSFSKTERAPFPCTGKDETRMGAKAGVEIGVANALWSLQMPRTEAVPHGRPRKEPCPFAPSSGVCCRLSDGCVSGRFRDGLQRSPQSSRREAETRLGLPGGTQSWWSSCSLLVTSDLPRNTFPDVLVTCVSV